jgi:hypothetical protein
VAESAPISLLRLGGAAVWAPAPGAENAARTIAAARKNFSTFRFKLCTARRLFLLCPNLPAVG